MTITYNWRYPTNIQDVKSNFRKLHNKDIIVFNRLSDNEYHNPTRVVVDKLYDNMVVCHRKTGQRECFKYVDFYSGDLVYQKVEEVM